MGQQGKKQKRSLTGKADKRKRNRRVRKAVRAAAILLPVAAILLGGSYVYAKYLKESVQRGVAIASSVWFTSNYAFPVTENADNDNMTGVMKIQAASIDEDGKNYNFTVEIRNYKNILVFNNSSNEIPYTISFWLSGTPAADDDYRVTPVYKDRAADGTVTETTGSAQTIEGGKKTEFTHTPGLPGGEALEDEYQISISSPGGNPVSIYVMARTTDDAGVRETLKGEILLVRGTADEEYLREASFATVSDDETARFEELEKQSVLNYKIVTGAAEAGTDELTLYWDPAVYRIDLFANSYILWTEDHTSEASSAEWAQPHALAGEIALTALPPLSPDEPDWHADWNGVDGKISYITIRADSYASITTGFFRGDGFADQGIADAAGYEKYIHVEAGLPAAGQP